jgi:hypothetical protein
MDNNVAFYIYKETIRESIERTSCIPPQVVDAYKTVVRFKVGRHHMYVQEKKDSDQQWFPTQYRLTEDDMGHIMVDWDDEWKIPPTETRPSERQNPEVQEIDDDEEEGVEQERGKGT